jgi:hypothetical protein
MPVEDIDFLSKNSEKDGHLVFIDSSLRNKTTHPFPAEYEVRFTESYQNVIGIEILDSMIPSTMYTVDIYNDFFKMFLAYLGYKVRYNDIPDQNVPPGNYLGVILETTGDADNLIEELEVNAKRPGESFQSLWNKIYNLLQQKQIDDIINSNHGVQYMCVYDQTAAKFWIGLDPVTNRRPPDANTYLVYPINTQTVSDPYYASPSYVYTFMNMDSSPPTVSESLLPTNKIVLNLSRIRLECFVAEMGTPISSDAVLLYEETDSQGNVKYIYHLNNDILNADLQRFWPALYNSQYRVNSFKKETSSLFGTIGIIELEVWNLVYLTDPGWSKLTDVGTPFVNQKSAPLKDRRIQFIIANIPFYIEHGNYDINSFASYINTNFPSNLTYVISKTANNTVTSTNPFNIIGNDTPRIFKSSLSGAMEKQMKYRIEVLNPYVNWYLDLKGSTLGKELGFGTYATHPDNPTKYSRVDWWPSGNLDIVTFMDGETDLYPPGIVNLAGAFYVLLRCPEIESHLYNSFAYSQNCPGIAMFRLGSIMQLREPRLDFTNFVKKPFHPIGKLSKLTLRFELPTGQLYDFKGIDHNILLTLKFYAPKLIEPKIKYTLNPNYNPNYLEYMVERMNIEAHEESHKNKTIIQREQEQSKYKYLLEEINKHDYSSSGEEYDDESDDDSEIDIVDKYTI